MSRIMVTCVDMFYVEENGIRQNIYGANADVILTTIRINYDQILRAPNMIDEEIMVSRPIMEVISLLDQLLMALII